jgi:hypothetical protein
MISSAVPDHSEWPIIVSAAIALAGVLGSAVISSIISRRSIYINSVTVERSKWIEKLRSNIADFCAAAASVELEYHFGKPMPRTEILKKLIENDAVRDILRLDILIKLQLNPQGAVDQNLIKLLDVVPEMMFEDGTSKLSSIQGLIVLHSQWLLKQEWEKVKIESAGWYLRRQLQARAEERLKKYEKFCQSEDGSLNNLHSTESSIGVLRGEPRDT